MGLRPRTIRRIIARASVFLLLAAIVNIAVAWGCALAIHFDTMWYLDGASGGVLEVEHSYQHWLVHRDQKPGACRIASQWADRDLRIDLSGAWPENRPEALIPDWAASARPDVASASRSTWHYRWVDARGWPLLALGTGIACDTSSHANAESVRILGGIPIDQPTLGSMRSIGGNQRFIPLRPIWPGFAINTLFYAGILWLLFAAPFALRRRFRGGRIKRGLCPACAYPVGDSPVCSECGKAVEQRSHFI
jgi:hypothetical protein